MKRVSNLSLVTVLLSGLIALPVFAESNMKDMVAEHERLAARYEQLAAEQEALVQEHEAMIAGGKTQFVNPKATLGERKRAMERHCERIIATAKQQRDEFRDLAEWHKESAQLVQ